MINITFFTFKKAKNSTKRPSDAGVTYSCELIESTSIYSPSIKLNVGAANVTGTNYCYISDFNRYYFIDRWTWEDGLWIGDLTTDVLATWKDDIGNLSAYVLRSAEEYDGRIVDNMYPCKTSPVYRANGITNSEYETNLANGTYIVGIVTGNTNASIGATTYYAMDSAGIRSFVNEIINTTLWDSITDISGALLRTLFDPFQYITTCTWIPFSISTLLTYGIVDGNGDNVHLGWWQLTTTARTVDKAKFVKTMNSTLSKHPQAESRGAYLNSAPFSTYHFISNAFGCFDLPDMAKFDGWQVSITYDLVSGSALLRLYGSLGDTVTELLKFATSFGMDIPLAQSKNDILSGASGTIAGGIQAAAGVASGNIAVGITGVLSAVGSALQAVKPHVSSAGGSGSFAAATDNDFTILGTFYEVADEDKADKGRPLCKVKKLNTLSGYIQCSESEYNLPCYGDEYDQINGYLSGGFFYE